PTTFRVRRHQGDQELPRNVGPWPLWPAPNTPSRRTVLRRGGKGHPPGFPPTMVHFLHHEPNPPQPLPMASSGQTARHPQAAGRYTSDSGGGNDEEAHIEAARPGHPPPFGPCASPPPTGGWGIGRVLPHRTRGAPPPAGSPSRRCRAPLPPEGRHSQCL